MWRSPASQTHLVFDGELGNRFGALNALGEYSRPANEGVTISYALVWDAAVEAGIELGFVFMSSSQHQLG